MIHLKQDKWHVTFHWVFGALCSSEVGAISVGRKSVSLTARLLRLMALVASLPGLHIYIYIYIERERETYMYTYIYIYIHIHVYTRVYTKLTHNKTSICLNAFDASDISIRTPLSEDGFIAPNTVNNNQHVYNHLHCNSTQLTQFDRLDR